MGHTLRCCVWCWVFHGGIGLATTSFMGTYQNYQTRSRAGLRRLKLAGHCIRHPELLARDLVTWEPEAQRGEAKRDRPKQSYLSTLIRDVGTKTKEELRTLMRDRDL